MSFRELYDYSQTVAGRIKRNDIRERAERLSGIGRVAVMRAAMDVSHCRGMYLSLRNNGHRFVQQHGCNVVVLARDLDLRWERYVAVKELMHVFSDPIEATDTGDKFEKLLSELSGDYSDISPAMKSELDCAWMAMAVLCPENTRVNYRHSLSRGDTDYYTISQELRIPEQHVYHLLGEVFEREIARILAEPSRAG